MDSSTSPSVSGKYPKCSNDFNKMAMPWRFWSPRYRNTKSNSSGSSWNPSASSSRTYDDLKRGNSPSMQPPQHSGGGTTGYHFTGALLLDLKRLVGLIAASLPLAQTAPLVWHVCCQKNG